MTSFFDEMMKIAEAGLLKDAAFVIPKTVPRPSAGSGGLFNAARVVGKQPIGAKGSQRISSWMTQPDWKETADRGFAKMVQSAQGAG